MKNLLIAALTLTSVTAFAAPLSYKASCSVDKLNLESGSSKVVVVAKKTVTVSPRSGSNKADIVLEADDLVVEYTSLFTPMELGKGEIYLGGSGFLKIKNIASNDTILAGGEQSTLTLKSTSKIDSEFNYASQTITLGNIAPKDLNSYRVFCKTTVKN